MMKKAFGFSLLLIFVSVFQLFAQETAAVKNGAEIQFEETSHDFGDIIQGDKVQYIYKFTNKGNQPLVISEVVTTCGCTAPTWSKEPVMPGKTGEVHVSFNSENKMGRQNKVITILSNATNNPSRVSIICNVLPKKE